MFISDKYIFSSECEKLTKAIDVLGKRRYQIGYLILVSFGGEAASHILWLRLFLQIGKWKIKGVDFRTIGICTGWTK